MEESITTADELRKAFSAKQLDIWLLAGYHAYLKRKQPKSGSKLRKLDSKLKTLSKSEIKRIITLIR